jgi:hypothetical protein
MRDGAIVRRHCSIERIFGHWIGAKLTLKIYSQWTTFLNPVVRRVHGRGFTVGHLKSDMPDDGV